MTGTTCTGLGLSTVVVNQGAKLVCIMTGTICTGLGLGMGVMNINRGAKHVCVAGKRSATAAQASLFTTQLAIDWQNSLLTAAHGYLEVYMHVCWHLLRSACIHARSSWDRSWRSTETLSGQMQRICLLSWGTN